MKPPELDYVTPISLDEVVDTLRREPDAKILAGGQSMLPLLNFRLAAPSLLVDLARVPGLDAIELDGGTARIGAMVRQRRAEEHAELAEAIPLFHEALRHVAHPQIRSRGTIGGSVAHADPAAELPAVLLALDGRIQARGPAGARTVAAGDLFAGFLTTTLSPDEVLTTVELPAAPARTGAACVELSRRAGDYALCGVVAQVTLDDGLAADVRVALFGVGQQPVRARATEEIVCGEHPDADRVAAAADYAAEGLDPADDVHATASYRRHLARVLTRRALTVALERAS
jgi:aerobic carbon-monoxide dehydrogenase medium subunit